MVHRARKVICTQAEKTPPILAPPPAGQLLYCERSELLAGMRILNLLERELQPIVRQAGLHIER